MEFQWLIIFIPTTHLQTVPRRSHKKKWLRTESFHTPGFLPKTSSFTSWINNPSECIVSRQSRTDWCSIIHVWDYYPFISFNRFVLCFLNGKWFNQFRLIILRSQRVSGNEGVCAFRRPLTGPLAIFLIAIPEAFIRSSEYSSRDLFLCSGGSHEETNR